VCCKCTFSKSVYSCKPVNNLYIHLIEVDYNVMLTFQLLKDCCKMVTTLAESVEDPSTVKQFLQMNGYKLIEHRVVAGVKLPPGTELDQIEEDPAKGTFTLYWRIPNNLVVDVFSVINNQVCSPVIESKFFL
jgi:hypothetical protein